ncbi:SDR family oxidoreductase [candidate division KSB1 bacterium]
MGAKIVLFGASGRLGKELVKLGDFIVPSHKEVSIEDHDRVNACLEETKPSIVIHAAALVGAKECEEEKEKAYKINVEGTYNIAKACQKHNIKLVFISTDTIFDGERGNYKEEDTPNPINYYSLTKLMGECFVKMLNSYIIIRTSFIPKESFPYPKAFTDQYTCRMTADKLAADILLAIEKNVEGIIHIAGERETLYNIAKKINPNVGKITRAETGLNLPKDLSLNTDKWKKIKGE